MIEVGRRIGVALHGVGMPGHFLVGVDGRSRRPRRPVPRRRASSTPTERTRSFARVQGPGAPFRPEFLAPTPNRLVLLRMLANLQQTYVTRRAADARWVAQLRLAFPELPAAERGQAADVLASVGAFDEAAAVLDELLADTTDLTARDALGRRALALPGPVELMADEREADDRRCVCRCSRSAARWCRTSSCRSRCSSRGTARLVAGLSRRRRSVRRRADRAGLGGRRRGRAVRRRHRGPDRRVGRAGRRPDRRWPPSARRGCGSGSGCPTTRTRRPRSTCSTIRRPAPRRWRRGRRSPPRSPGSSSWSGRWAPTIPDDLALADDPIRAAWEATAMAPIGPLDVVAILARGRPRRADGAGRRRHWPTRPSCSSSACG